MKEIHFTETVQFYDTDCGGVVSNIAYLRFVEKARTTLFDDLGMTLESMNESQLFPAVVRTEIDYRYPARLGDEVRVTAKLTSVEKVRATCEFTLDIPGAEDGLREVARACQIVALVQMPSGRPRRMPAEWRDFVD
jgi:4-hydroxybenzoyl-CoA thioesterase/acyl-CoA thioester hydrolase